MIFKKSISIFFTLLMTAMILSCDGGEDSTVENFTEPSHVTIVYNGNGNNAHSNTGNNNDEEQTEEQIMITAIPDYPSYFLSASNKRLYGLSPDGPQEIIVSNSDEFPLVFKNFFTVSAVKYFHVSETDLSDPEEPVEVEKFYSQTNGAIKLIDELPAVPASERVVLSDPHFSIVTVQYGGEDYSDVRNLVLETGINRNKMIDGFLFINNKGLYFNIVEGRGTLNPPGLYWWDVTRTSIYKVLDSGRVW